MEGQKAIGLCKDENTPWRGEHCYLTKSVKHDAVYDFAFSQGSISFNLMLEYVGVCCNSWACLWSPWGWSIPEHVFDPESFTSGGVDTNTGSIRNQYSKNNCMCSETLLSPCPVWHYTFQKLFGWDLMSIGNRFSRALSTKWTRGGA